MPLDPQLQPLIDGFEPFMSIDWSGIDPAMVRQMADQVLPDQPVAEVSRIDEITIGVDGRSLAARLYHPADGETLPVVLYAHGGGWTIGSLDAYDAFCRKLAVASGCAILSVDYRLAPEHPYPAALGDCMAALKWLHAEGASHGLCVERIAVAGDSAGGNLATALAFACQSEGCAPPCYQLLFYPVIDRACNTPSYSENTRYLLTPDMMRWYWQNYTQGRPAEEVPFAMPSEFADLSQLPPATIVTAEFDPLRDEGEEYALTLARAGVPTELVRVPGMIHGFASMIGIVDAADHWLNFAAGRLGQALKMES